MLRTAFSALSPAGRRARLSTLIFHRVLPAPDPMFPHDIDATRFDAICGWLARWFAVLPLDRAVRGLRNGDLPARALSITFDDGYADNHDIALPILQRHGLTASFFIATGFLDGGRMWNDTVIEAVRQHAGPVLDLSPLGIDRLARVELRTPADRAAAVDRIIMAIKYLAVAERLAMTERIAALAGARPSDALMMTSTQVRALHRAGMQIGAHTVSHPILAVLGDDAARSEIERSKQRLETIVDAPVTLFAYPNGRPVRDYDARSIAIARAAGFEAAVSTAKGSADASTDPFQLPRFTPWEASRWRFGLRLAGNLTGPATRDSLAQATEAAGAAAP